MHPRYWWRGDARINCFGVAAAYNGWKLTIDDSSSIIIGSRARDLFMAGGTLDKKNSVIGIIGP